MSKFLDNLDTLNWIIKDLRAELAAERAKAVEHITEKEFLRQRLAEYVNYWRNRDLKAMTAERDELREALKPFAALWDTEETYRIGGFYSLRVKYEDIKRARDALKGDGRG